MMGEIHRIMLGDVCGLHALGMFVADLFKSRWQLEAENLSVIRQRPVRLDCVPGMQFESSRLHHAVPRISDHRDFVRTGRVSAPCLTYGF
jgi:hypothetical protein